MTPPLYWAREHSDCLSRQCLGAIRPFKPVTILQKHCYINRTDSHSRAVLCNDRMTITATGTGANLAVLDRPLMCTCLCLCRPVLNVLDAGNNMLGSVMSPFSLTDWTWQVRAPGSGQVWYELHGDCCALRCGSCCALRASLSSSMEPAASCLPATPTM